MEKLLPQNVEAEAQTLGSIEIGGVEALVLVADLLQPSDFYDPRHEAIYAAMLDVWKRREPLALLNITDALDRAGMLDAVGGTSYVSSLINRVQNWTAITSYAEKVEATARRRRIIAAAHEMANAAYQEADADEAQALAEIHLRTALLRGGREEGTDIADAVDAFLDEIDEAMQSGTTPGITTGFRDLDAHLSGFLPTELMYLCARPGSFKSTIASAVALHVARTYGRVEWVSLEMSHVQLAKRILTSWARVNGRIIRSAFRRPDGSIDHDSYDRVRSSADDIKQLRGKLRLYDQPMTMERLRQHAMRAVYQRGCKLLIVDYLGLLDGDNARDSEYQRITKISKALKQLALELKIPVLCLVQMNRDSEKRADKRPTMSDMRDSGGLEQDPDWVIGLHYEARYNEKLAELDPHFRQFLELHVLKAREGVANVMIPLRIEGEYTRPSDWPTDWAWRPYTDTKGDNE